MKLTFPKDFIWGAASASYQVEGAAFEDGRGESIWDRYCQTPGNIEAGDSGAAACDQYHRYKDDVALMKKMGLHAYRCSIGWPRIQPDGAGAVNQKGLDYYSRLVDELLGAGITPFITLYHWDLPQALQDRGGWCNPDTAKYFGAYAGIVFDKLGDRVKHWMTLNEPYCAAIVSNHVGRHAPGIRDFATALRVSYFLYVGHGLALKCFREGNYGGDIGIALNLMNRMPYNPQSEADKAAAVRADGILNRWFLDPLLRGTYPADMVEWYRRKGITLPPFETDELRLMSQKLDFIGLNYYNDAWAVHNPADWPEEAELRNPPHTPASVRDWALTETGFEKMLIRLKAKYGVQKILITENGTATHDLVSVEGRVEDSQRVDYLKRHLAALHRALAAGVNVFGYMQWSFTDNFEWAFGYDSRFGLVYIDYVTQKRILKQSGEWYAQVIANNGFDISDDYLASIGALKSSVGALKFSKGGA
ncbi:MAG: beta-glucosidase [Spirochaetaceae bacterium]|jgi:beta-glucosidase|nr:beta-glucosidase [Spirochaetaceae bacterium]